MSNQTTSSIGKLRSVKQIKSSLKPRAPVAKGNLILQLGTAKVKILAEVRAMHKDGMIFVHIPTYSELMVDGKVVNDDQTANEAWKSLVPKVSRAPQPMAMPPGLVAALSKIPDGAKLIIKDGAYKLIKTHQKIGITSPSKPTTSGDGKIDWDSVVKQALTSGPKTVDEIVSSMSEKAPNSGRSSALRACNRNTDVYIKEVRGQAHVFALKQASP